MPELDSRAYCHAHKYFAGKRWKTAEEADADKKSHEEDNPGDYVQIEELQTGSDLKVNYLSQQFMIHSALELLSGNNQQPAAETGACIISLPTGEPKCYQLTSEQCKKLGGNYVGGKCQ